MQDGKETTAPQPPENQGVVPNTSSQTTCVAMGSAQHEAQGPLRRVGVRGNLRSLGQYRYQVWKYWRQCLRKRSQTLRTDRLKRLLNECYILPLPKIAQPDNWLPIDSGYLLGRAGCGKAASRFCEGEIQ